MMLRALPLGLPRGWKDNPQTFEMRPIAADVVKTMSFAYQVYIIMWDFCCVYSDCLLSTPIDLGLSAFNITLTDEDFLLLLNIRRVRKKVGQSQKTKTKVIFVRIEKIKITNSDYFRKTILSYDVVTNCFVIRHLV